jgi:hypothetical protein
MKSPEEFISAIEACLQNAEKLIAASEASVDKGAELYGE